MNIRVFENSMLASQAAACLMGAQVLRNPSAVLGLATGSTPIPAYRELVRMTQSGVLDFSRVTTFNLDEYVGLDHEHEQSYYYFMMEHLFSKINIKKASIHVPSGIADDVSNECIAYEQAILASGGIDLQLLGLGRNGHIGFNEPAETFTSRTHVVSLTEDTIEANARFFDDRSEVPKQAISMGVGTIMKARSIVMLVTGASKARAARNMICGPVSPSCPASILQLHPAAVVLLDRQAASTLNQCYSD